MKIETKKPFYKKWWFWTLIVIFLIGVGGSGDDTPSVEPSNTPNIESSNTPNVEPAPPSSTNTPSTEKAENIVRVGEVIHTKGFDLTVQSAGVFVSSNPYSKPSDGKEFVAVKVLIENTGKEDINVSSLLCFDAYVDDFAVDMGFVSDAGDSPDGTISSGKKLIGTLCYELPVDWKCLEIDVNIDMFSTKDDLKIVVNNTAK